jgi:hypothetical protein
MLGNVYYENAYTSTLFEDTNRAKRRVRRNEMKAYDPAKANAKKQLKDDINAAKSQITSVDVNPQFNSMLTAGIGAVSLCEELLSLLQQGVSNRTYTGTVFLSKTTGILSRLDSTFTIIYNTLKSIVPTFNNLKPMQVQELSNLFNTLENKMVDIDARLAALVNGASPAQAGIVAELDRLGNIVISSFEDLIKVNDPAAPDLFSNLLQQYNYLKPTQAGMQIIRANVARARVNAAAAAEPVPAGAVVAVAGDGDSMSADSLDSDSDSDSDVSSATDLSGRGRYCRCGKYCNCGAYPFQYATRTFGTTRY